MLDFQFHLKALSKNLIKGTQEKKEIPHPPEVVFKKHLKEAFEPYQKKSEDKQEKELPEKNLSLPFLNLGKDKLIGFVDLTGVKQISQDASLGQAVSFLSPADVLARLSKGELDTSTLISRYAFAVDITELAPSVSQQPLTVASQLVAVITFNSPLFSILNEKPEPKSSVLGSAEPFSFSDVSFNLQTAALSYSTSSYSSLLASSGVTVVIPKQFVGNGANSFSVQAALVFAEISRLSVFSDRLNASITPLVADSADSPVPVVAAPVVDSVESPTPVVVAPVVDSVESPTPVVVAPVVDSEESPAPAVAAPVVDSTDSPAPVVAAPVVDSADSPAPVVAAPVVDSVESPAPAVAAPVVDSADSPAPAVVAPVVDSADSPAPVVAAPVVDSVESPAPAVAAPVVDSVESPAPAVVAPVVDSVESPAPVVAAPVVDLADSPAPAVAAPAVAVPVVDLVESPAPAVTAPVVDSVESPAPAVVAPAVDSVESPVPVVVAPAVDSVESPAPAVVAPVVDSVESPAPAVVAPVVDSVESPTPVVVAPVVDSVESPAPVVVAPVVDSVESPAPVVVAPVVDLVESPAPVVAAPAVVQEILATPFASFYAVDPFALSPNSSVLDEVDIPKEDSPELVLQQNLFLHRFLVSKNNNRVNTLSKPVKSISQSFLSWGNALKNDSEVFAVPDEVDVSGLVSQNILFGALSIHSLKNESVPNQERKKPKGNVSLLIQSMRVGVVQSPAVNVGLLNQDAPLKAPQKNSFAEFLSQHEAMDNVLERVSKQSAQNTNKPGFSPFFKLPAFSASTVTVLAQALIEKSEVKVSSIQNAQQVDSKPEPGVSGNSRDSESSVMAPKVSLSASQVIQAINQNIPIHIADFPAFVSQVLQTQPPTVNKAQSLQVTLSPDALGKITADFQLTSQGQVNITLMSQSVLTVAKLETYLQEIQQIVGKTQFGAGQIVVKQGLAPAKQSQSFQQSESDRREDGEGKLVHRRGGKKRRRNDDEEISIDVTV